jgi:selenocysteine lyase/cysteine desulfurase
VSTATLHPATAAEAAFLEAEPAFRETAILDALRAAEYERLDANQVVYLDYGGGGLHARSQVEEHQQLLRETVLGNPHSMHPASAASTALVERARSAVLRWFGAPADEYECIFTANATGALRLVGEAYPFAPGGRFLALADNHNSVNGIRQFARSAGARASYVPLEAPELRVADDVLHGELADADARCANLFAYPAQSNFSGVKHPLDWIRAAHERGWDVLVDAAAFAPTSRLDLAAWRPDFVAVSFYKLLGYPTGIGALLARRDALARLQRPWFSGGTVLAATVGRDLVVPAPGHAAFEDGTVDYLGIPAVEIGLRHLERIGIDVVSQRVACLGRWLLGALGRLCYADGDPAVRIYGPATWEGRGATIAFNFLHPDGRVVDERFVDACAAARDISLRTGCFCNPGAAEASFGLSPERLARMRPGPDASIDDLLADLGMPSGGAIRISLGVATNFADVDRFLTFAHGICDLRDVPLQLPPRHAC